MRIRTSLLGVLLAMAIPRAAAAVDDAGWVTLYENEDENKGEIGSARARVLVSADESRVAHEESFVGTGGSQHTASICPARAESGTPAKPRCDVFWIEIPEGGGIAGDRARFDRALADGGFAAVPLKLIDARSARLGGLRVSVQGGKLRVRDGRKVLLDVELEEKHNRIAAIGRSPAGRPVILLQRGLFVVGAG